MFCFYFILFYLAREPAFGGKQRRNRRNGKNFGKNLISLTKLYHNVLVTNWQKTKLFMFAVCQVAINLTRNRLTHPQSSFMTRDMEARDGKQGVRAPSRSPSRASFKKNWASQRNRIGSCLDFRLGCIVGDSINSMPCIWHNSISSLALKS